MNDQMDPLTDKEIEDRLAELPGWSVGDGRLTRTYGFDKHVPAAAMVVHVAQLQEELNHHSDLRLGYNTLTVSLSTHSAGDRITERDFELARRIEAVSAGHGAR
ncbi:4a-hydroxytetrahydrobiopterin dehydratase [Streptomyces sp. MST-110588]|uniref:4a-hydroxytetrahydrobiopterin dehydratase n=1 Tax=Streptomyces sp. MST-110588 TaxID=2833628 RepID=UPI001F5CFAC3|nr:4a-hydroxytetrahydrobiopterin dehydratase [Streptomyces sp. MST-110588]UNO39215.1 4a-hydroxytetrahydrobiopterin dehydratase [Streptomyces sp. MST-110588]